jgi:hypothetical protein
MNRGRSIQSVEIPCTADSDDNESELEELNTVESVRETEMSDNIL